MSKALYENSVPIQRPPMIVKRDRQAEEYARRNAKSAIESLARLYPDAFREVVDKILLTSRRD